ncbi:NAD(P)-binding protein [Conexibacter sp. W3-3-2]|uniref:GMC oxidoreductase n=1 Tax=Conexibacter sp. W3-3-2 TaxID=2675227 RepID=UPI0012B6DB45|nr:GMC family oxidoreductase [Conexibacter sp. W3-3-2]MTD44085.1 NAD(P)-binding protein [Conexibacter sp. W3-3-2]
MSGVERQYDYDWIVIGSGFGGSVSALRLAQKGYKVLVLEAGRRFEDKDFPKSTWDARNYFFAPKLGMRGILRLSIFKDIFIASGAGVGGGSLGYANTLYRAPERFYNDGQWSSLGNWGVDLEEHYDEAERMLGVTDYWKDDAADQLLKEFGEEIGCGDTYSKTRVGVYQGTPGVTVPDPFFDGEGPDRTGCIDCGRCMVGCPHGAKNTLVKNYLYLAEKLGVRVEPSRMVLDVRPLARADGSDGYVVTDERAGSWVRKGRRELRARGVIFSAGALGTNRLLANIKHRGSLSISDQLGELVRTNSEAILGITVPEDFPADITDRVAITSSIYPDPDTHIETCVYGDAGGSMQYLNTILTGDGTRVTRPLKWAATAIRHPRQFWKATFFKGGSKRAIIILVMQTLDNAIALRAKPKRFGKGVKLVTEQDPLKPNPTFIPIGNTVTQWFADRTGGVPQSSTMEALFNIPSTAHILGGAVIGADATTGVIDKEQRIFGYENLMVCDGAAVPANIGVNPSLTITAMTELAMSRIPRKGEDRKALHAAPTPIDLAITQVSPEPVAVPAGPSAAGPASPAA